MQEICAFVEPRDLSPSEEAFHVELQDMLVEADFAAVLASLEHLPDSVETVQHIPSVKPAEAYTAKGVAAPRHGGGLVLFLPTPSNPNPPTYTAPKLTLVQRLNQRLNAPKGNAQSTPLHRPAWTSLGTNGTIREVFRYGAQNDAVAYSLNFTPKVAARLQASADPARSLSRALNRASQIAVGFLLQTAFAFEYTREGRLHVHGIAIVPDTVILDTFREILKSAGGNVTGLGSGRQCDVREMTNSSGWHGYCDKDAARTRRLLGTDKITFISQDLRRATEDTYRAQSVIVTHRRVRTAKQATDTRKAPKTNQRAALSHAATPALRISLVADHMKPVGNKSALSYYLKLPNKPLYTRFDFVDVPPRQQPGVLHMTTATYIETVAYNRLLDALANFDPHVLNGKPDRFGYADILGEFGDIWPEAIREGATLKIK